MGIEKCFNIWGASGPGTIHLEIDRTGMVDYTPFFKDFFKRYDRIFHTDIERKRFEPEKARSVFRFTRNEFSEAFLLNYTPEEMADFIESRIDMDDFQAESFVHQIKTFNDHFRIGNIYSVGDGFAIDPRGFSKTEINDIIPKGQIPKTICSRERYYGLKGLGFTNLSKPVRWGYLDRLKDQLASLESPILIGNKHDSAPRLHDIDIIAKYGLPIENLKVVKNI